MMKTFTNLQRLHTPQSPPACKQSPSQRPFANIAEAQQQHPTTVISRRAQLIGTVLGVSIATTAADPPRTDAYILDEDNATQVFQSAAPSVVGIIDLKVSKDGEEALEGVGSGVVWDKYGHVITNYHCVAKLAKDTSGRQVTRVELIDNMGIATQYDAVLVASDPPSDVAVLKINAPPEVLSPVIIAPSSSLRIGQYAYAIGNPLGYTKTLTSGVISGLNRSIPSPTGQRIPGVIQTDAAISSGNSGGPLLNSAGQMIGINTATFTRSGTGRSSGVNFAIPSELVVRIVPNLIVYGSARVRGQ